MRQSSAVRSWVYNHNGPANDMRILSERLGIVGLILASGVLTGCASNSPSGEHSPDMSDNQRVLRSEASKFNETVGTPAVIGAVGGAVLGGLLCKKNRAACAAGGGAAGALIGGGAGYLVALQNEKFANREAEVRGRSNAAKAEVERFDQVISATNNVILEHKQDIAVLGQRYRAGAASRDDYQKRVAVINDDIGALKANISSNQKDIDAINGDLKRLGRSGTSELAAERDQLLRQKRTLELQLQELIGISKRAATS
jgi:hypothetical protein